MVQAGVVVAADEMQVAIQAGEILHRGLAAVIGEVADDVYAVVCADAGVQLEMRASSISGTPENGRAVSCRMGK